MSECCGLRLLTMFMKIVGVDLNPSSRLISRLLVTSLGIFILASNIVINRPRLSELLKKEQLYEDGEEDEQGVFYENAWIHLVLDPHGFVRLVRFACKAFRFYFVPVIHICFLSFLFYSQKERRSFAILLRQIVVRMRSGRTLYLLKFRKNCFIALLFVIFVRIIFPNVTTTFHEISKRLNEYE